MDLPNETKIKSVISSYERHIGQQILIPTWLPPKYKPISVGYTEREFSIKYSKAQMQDGTISLLIQNGETVKNEYFKKITLINGKEGFLSIYRLKDPFEYIPTHTDEVFLYFYSFLLLRKTPPNSCTPFGGQIENL